MPELTFEAQIAEKSREQVSNNDAFASRSNVRELYSDMNAVLRAYRAALGDDTLPQLDLFDSDDEQIALNGNSESFDAGETGDNRPKADSEDGVAPARPEGVLNQQSEPIRSERQQADAVAAQERPQRLIELMCERGATAEELERFRADIETLRGRTEPSEFEINLTLVQVERLMADDNDQRVEPDERRRIAMQIVAHAANPSTIDQGQHSTCNVTTLEERMFTGRVFVSNQWGTQHDHWVDSNVVFDAMRGRIARKREFDY